MSKGGNVSRLRVSEFKLNTLLELTNAINNNLPELELFILFQYILEHQLNIGKALIFLREGESWSHALSYGVSAQEKSISVDQDLGHLKDITVMEMIGNKQSKSFDVVIPVFHQKNIIAYVLLGDLDEQELKASPIIKHLPFIQTLANITAVAVENKRLTEKNLRQELLNRELEMAREMQKMLLPSTLPNDDKLQVAASYHPHQEIGGDFYDVIRVSDDEFYICIADVSGKGISAAILMASFQTSLRSNVQKGRALKDIMIDLNNRVWSNAQGERFITIFLAHYNASTKELKYVNSAHPPPHLLNNGKLVKLIDGCVGLGMFEEFPTLNVGSVKLKSNAIMIAYTDGLTELENEAGVPFNDSHLDALFQDRSVYTMSGLNVRIFEALDKHRGSMEFHDDVALVSCRFL
jgi:sigma-B regulation protein RsbU (phosphoserine phosphatase)